MICFAFNKLNYLNDETIYLLFDFKYKYFVPLVWNQSNISEVAI